MLITSSNIFYTKIKIGGAMTVGCYRFNFLKNDRYENDDEKTIVF